MRAFPLPDQLVTRARIRLVAMLVLAATVIGLLYLFATAHGTVDSLGRPLGTDFSNVWSAGWMADHGRAPDAWNWARHYDVQKQVHHDVAIPFYGWHYPPPFLIIATLLAQFPYVAALVLWQGSTLMLALALVRRILPGDRDAMLVALGAPVVLICLGHGQNAFLTASLLGTGMLLLDRRPWVAGMLLGALVYKPQFAVLIPVVIIARGNWRAFVAAALTVMALCLVTLAIWGWPVWRAFLDSLPLTQHIVIEAGDTGWEKIPSPFAAMRQWGGSIPIAYGVQAVVTAIAIGAAALAARRGSTAVRGAAALSAALLCTPYVLDYDFVLLGVAIAFLVADMQKRGVLAWEPTGLAYAWIAPLFGRFLSDLTHIPVDLIAAIAVLALAVRRAILLDGALARFRSSPSRHSHAASGR
ncbi:glycosyltransferase family 87 protein [Sphingobium sp. CR2-8]|uniref:glycosyltransferase family 87 protein n=1 Tax=Sphingobium sp. CR2-8 TaxID=1306534 RepID=UPI002DB8714A|nr:glycosyltransferase family 87 protein [Sphingobium sp. CR2-8]MEC3910769.1 glycosyltransferase family 87 protein [Sphingobium sp. CR2-8]